MAKSKSESKIELSEDEMVETPVANKEAEKKNAPVSIAKAGREAYVIAMKNEAEKLAKAKK